MLEKAKVVITVEVYVQTQALDIEEKTMTTTVGSYQSTSGSLINTTISNDSRRDFPTRRASTANSKRGKSEGRKKIVSFVETDNSSPGRSTRQSQVKPLVTQNTVKIEEYTK
jgi:hypothetical protein